ncbi:hypothetical protein [Asticcacaulis benevestitus]|uniref:Uncharacterized protein n=1 Tax=Asticcacaulis benevestitus DSM 16100 = ATCC BAA-896 TaxID=1121022 RepID=V4PSW2_9CAUL|nr:hypothetical protein [Asticcacaulis benevestitus]ESQ90459.1 hypothetical protein ABENE_12110 [Asticcacaulis benevestitus DSM 16100 = ATCC BAA-896]
MVFIPRQHRCRLFVLIARDARVGVIFRHGPKKHTRMIRWDLSQDRFDAGQWFKGSIFDHFSDVSPNGDFVIYYASKHTGDPPAWTAISQPPYFTALAVWPQAHTSSGGGLLMTDGQVMLNHLLAETALLQGFKLRKGMTVERRNWEAHSGKDLYHTRLLRDGWRLLDDSRGFIVSKKNWPLYEKTSLFDVRLWMQLSRRAGVDALNFEVILPTGEVWLKGPNFDWADFDHNGDLLISIEGKLWRVLNSEIGLTNSQARLVADFSDMQFEPIKAPPGAVHWPNNVSGR